MNLFYKLLSFFWVLYFRSDCFKQSLSAADIFVPMKLFLLYFIAAIATILMDKSITNRDEPCSSNVIVLNNHEVLLLRI